MIGSPVDIALLFGAALLLFRPKKLPEIGRALGQGLGNFKRSLTDAQEEVKSAMKEAEQPQIQAQPVSAQQGIPAQQPVPSGAITEQLPKDIAKEPTPASISIDPPNIHS